MKNIKSFESWNNNKIDHSLFKSGKAKYDPTVSNGTIKYKTGDTLPYYHAQIERKGDQFICKVYKKKKNGDEIRLRNKLKKELKLAHNYVREFLNQKLKQQKEKKNRKKDSVEKSTRENPSIMNQDTMFPELKTPRMKPKRKTIVRRF